MRSLWKQIQASQAEHAQGAPEICRPGESNQAMLEELHAEEGEGRLSTSPVPVRKPGPRPIWAEDLSGAEDLFEEEWDTSEYSGPYRQRTGENTATQKGARMSGEALEMTMGSARRDGEVVTSASGSTAVTEHGMNVAGRVAEVRRRDAEGQVLDGSSARATIGKDGAAIGLEETIHGTRATAQLATNENGTTVSAGLKEGAPGSVPRSISYTDHKDGTHTVGGSAGSPHGTRGGFSYTSGEGTTGFGAKGGHGPVSAGASYTSMDNKRMAAFHKAESAMGAALDGPVISYGRLNAESFGGTLGVEMGPLGLDVGGGASEYAALEVHRPASSVLEDLRKDTETLQKYHFALYSMGVDPQNLDAAALERVAELKPELYRDLVGSQLNLDVWGITDLNQIDVDEMRAGSAYTARSGEGWNAALGANVAMLSASLGKEGQEAEQMLLARTGAESWRIEMTAMSQDSLKASLKAGKLGGISTDESTTETTSLSMDFHGPDGLKALKSFQETGLLPGADQVATDDWALQNYRMAKEEYDGLVEASKYVPMDLSKQQAALRERAAVLNSQMMDNKKLDLAKATVPGVDYETHADATTTSTMTEIDIGGVIKADSGDRHTTTDERYIEDGRTQKSYKSGHDADYWTGDDERASVVMNPREHTLTGPDAKQHKTAMLVTSEQHMNREQRESIDAIAGVQGIPESVREAWVDGSFDDSNHPVTQLAMTEDHLDVLARATTRNKDLWTDAQDLVGPSLDRLHHGNQGLLERMWEDASLDAQIRRKDYKDAAGDVLTPVLIEHGIDPAITDNLGATLDWVEQGSMQHLADKLAAVDGPEKFNDLSEAEQTLHLTNYVMQAVDSDGDPWNALAMAMQVPDKDQRNRHVRKLFDVIERRKAETHAAMDLIAHIQNAPYLEDGERDFLLSAVKVDLKDDRVEHRTKEIAGKQEAGADVADYVAGRMLGDAAALRDPSNQVWGKANPMVSHELDQSADKTVDWLQAAEKAGGTALMDQVLRKAYDKDPNLVQDIYSKTIEVDPVRAELYLELLAKTGAYREYAQQQQAIRKSVRAQLGT